MFRQHIISILDKKYPVQRIDHNGNIMNHEDIVWRCPVYTFAEIVQKLQYISDQQQKQIEAGCKHVIDSPVIDLNSSTENNLIKEMN